MRNRSEEAGLSCRQSCVARVHLEKAPFAMLALVPDASSHFCVYHDDRPVSLHGEGTGIDQCVTSSSKRPVTSSPAQEPQQPSPDPALPDDPGEEALPIAQPEPIPPSGIPVRYKADRQVWVNHTVTLTGVDEFHYRDYVLRADKIVYNQDTSELQAEGHLQLSGGPSDVVLTASHGDMRLNMHTARFYDVTGTLGVRRLGRVPVYSTPNPLLFSARVLLQNGEGAYKIIDGTMTNCRLPKPDWQLLARHIDIADGQASTTNTIFKLFGVPIFDLPYLRHPVDETGRASGFLIPVISNGSSIRGYTFGEQVYIVLNRSMDMVIGSEYYSKRGWAPNGDFRYKGPGLDHLTARWNALLDRGYEQLQSSGPQAGQTMRINQGGADIVALGRKDLTPDTRLAGNVEYLSSYVYRLVFNDNYWQAVSSEVKSDVSLTHTHNAMVPSLHMERVQTFASSAEGDEARLLHLPSLRFDMLDQPLAGSRLYGGLGSSLAIWDAPSPASMLTTSGASMSIRMSRFPSQRAVGASFPRAQCAPPSTPARRCPTSPERTAGFPA